MYGIKSDRGRPKHGISIFYNYKLGPLKNSSLLQNSLILNFEHLSVVCAYLNPNFKYVKPINSMKHADNTKKLIYAGDFKSQIDKKNPKGDLILDIASCNDFYLANTLPLKPTYVCEKGSSVIDLIFCGADIKLLRFSISDSYVRQHHFVTLECYIKSKIATQSERDKNNLRTRVDSDVMKRLINSNYRAELNENILTNDLESFYNNLLKLVEVSKIS